MRNIVILNDQPKNDTSALVNELIGFGVLSDADKIYVFSKNASLAEQCSIDAVNADRIEFVTVPEDRDSTPKFRNWVTRYCKNNIKGIVHVLQDTVEVLTNPIQFMNDVEHMMDALGHGCFFGTITDTCNRMYNKYVTRLNIIFDNDKYVKLGFGKSLRFCSHSNIQWVVYNLDIADNDELFFDEDFTIDMYFIIEFLARRRNKHPGRLYYMNQYATCESEHGVYAIRENTHHEERSNFQEILRAEDAIFKSKQIEYSPDNNIDLILEHVYEKLKTKI